MEKEKNMSVEELIKYRTQLFKDSVLMEKMPERFPLGSNAWTYVILDAGYKISEALNNYELIKKASIRFQEKYNFDSFGYDGSRNPEQVMKVLGESPYDIHDEKEIMNIKDFETLHEDEYDEFIENPIKFTWEKVLPRRMNKFNADTTEEQIIELLSKIRKFKVTTKE